MPSYRTVEEREHMVRIILKAPIEMSHRDVAQLVGLHRDSVRQTRYGIINSDVATDLPRLEANSLQRTCSQCVHFSAACAKHRPGLIEYLPARCDLGIPEAEQQLFARGCGAFTEKS